MSNPRFDRLDSKTTLLTVNSRLSRTLTQILEEERLSAGMTVWQTIPILPLSAWLEQCWDTLLDQWDTVDCYPPTLLTPWQERLVWEKVISDSPEGKGLLRISEAARNAQNAWKLLKEWHVTLTESDLLDHEDATVFHSWSLNFSNLMQKNQWLDQSSLAYYLSQHINRLFLPKQILLAGFQRVPPAHRILFSALEKIGVNVEQITSSGQPGHMNRIGFSDLESEIRAAALWSKKHLTQHTKIQENPNVSKGKVGIVIPNLTTLYPKVVEIFSNTFYPGTTPSAIDPLSRVFNISLGVGIAQTPLVQDALMLLGLAKGFVNLDHYFSILHSPFYTGGDIEGSQRSLLDARLRNMGKRSLSLSKLQKEATLSTQTSPACPILATLLKQFIDTLNNHSTLKIKEKPSVWAHHFSEWLSLLGWPGESGLSSGEYQIIQGAWPDTLMAFSSLDRVLEPLSLNNALSQLNRLSQEIPFQPESGEAPIHILGLLESVGESFDALWILGLSEEAWPPPLQPNPFLPIAFQRQHHMPKAHFEDESLFNSAIIHEITKTSREIILSYCTLKGDQPQRPSPLIASLPQQSIEFLKLSDYFDYNLYLMNASRMVLWMDDQGPPAIEEKTLFVSTGVVKSQSHCPFQAFARYRLKANRQEDPSTGLDASQRGQIVHNALGNLWNHINHQSNLKTALDPTNTWIEQSVKKALDRASQLWPDLLPPFFRTLEQTRLQRIIKQWLTVEQHRKDPFYVKNQEVDDLLELGELTIRLRIDRVDHLPETNQLVVLDYKTGKSNVSHWFGERPMDPQLPLYVLAQTQPVAAMAFAQLRAGDSGFHGLAVREDIMPKVSPFQNYAKSKEFENWESMVSNWQRILTHLTQAYLQGDARVDPLIRACDYCDLPSFCRLYEHTLLVNNPLLDEEIEGDYYDH